MMWLFCLRVQMRVLETNASVGKNFKLICKMKCFVCANIYAMYVIHMYMYICLYMHIHKDIKQMASSHQIMKEHHCFSVSPYIGALRTGYIVWRIQCKLKMQDLLSKFIKHLKMVRSSMWPSKRGCTAAQVTGPQNWPWKFLYHHPRREATALSFPDMNSIVSGGFIM